MAMADTREDEAPSDLVFFRVLDLRARRRETHGERLRPYCVLRLGDQHHRTRSFPPEGFDPVHARRTTVDDRKLAESDAPGTLDVDNLGVFWEVPSPRTRPDSQHKLAGSGPRVTRDRLADDGGDEEVVLEIYNTTDADTGLSIEGFDAQVLGVLKVTLSDLRGGGRETRPPDGAHSQRGSGETALESTSSMASVSVRLDCTGRGEASRVRTDQWFGGVVSPACSYRHGASRDSPASGGFVVEARLEVIWGGCNNGGQDDGVPRSSRPTRRQSRVADTGEGARGWTPSWPIANLVPFSMHRLTPGVHDSFGHAVDPRNARKCLAAEGLWRLQEPLQRKRWTSEEGQEIWSKFLSGFRSGEVRGAAGGTQDWGSELRERVWGGVPAEMREEVYMSLSGASSKRKLFESGYYEALVTECNKRESEQDNLQQQDQGLGLVDVPLSPQRSTSSNRPEPLVRDAPPCVERTPAAQPARPALVPDTSNGSMYSRDRGGSVTGGSQDTQPGSSTPCSNSTNSPSGRRRDSTTTACRCVGEDVPGSVSGEEVEAGGEGFGTGLSPQASRVVRRKHECGRTPAGPVEHNGESLDTRDKQDYFEVWREIEADLDRVFINGRTRVNETSGIATMRQLLRAYSLHNPAVGYCQGMNFIAGLLLEVVSEETAFWLLAVFCEDLHPEYHTKSMLGARSDIAALKDMVRCELPRFHNRATEVDMPLELKLTQWLLVGFVNCFPPSTALRILEVSFLEGSDTYLAAALAFLRLHEAEILQGEDIAEVVCTLDRAQAGMYETDILLTQVWRELALLGDEIRSARAWHRNRVLSLQEARQHQSNGGVHGPGDYANDDRSGWLQGRGSTASGSSAWLFFVPKSLADQVEAVLSSLNKRALTTNNSPFVEGKMARPSLVPFFVGGVRWLLGWKAYE